MHWVLLRQRQQMQCSSSMMLQHSLRMMERLRWQHLARCWRCWMLQQALGRAVSVVVWWRSVRRTLPPVQWLQLK